MSEDDEKKYLPMTTAGIVSYREETNEGIKLKPHHVMAAIVAVIIIELALSVMTKIGV